MTEEKAVEGYQWWRAYIKTNGQYPSMHRELHGTNAAQQDYEYHQTYSTVIPQRRLFITSSGLPGVGPKCMQQSDIIAILWGCPWPVVLRPLPQKDEYKVVGVAYVHGIMSGEAVEEHEAAGKPEQVFRLR